MKDGCLQRAHTSLRASFPHCGAENTGHQAYTPLRRLGLWHGSVVEGVYVLPFTHQAGALENTQATPGEKALGIWASTVKCLRVAQRVE